MTNSIPRRSQIDQFTPAEKAIYDATQAVEEVGAHPMLTKVVVLLGDARKVLADYVDGQRYDPFTQGSSVEAPEKP